MPVRPGVDSLRVEDAVKNTDGSARDMSAATSITCWLRRPDGSVTSVSGSWVTDGTDGVAEAFFTNPFGSSQHGTASFQFDFAGIAPGDVHDFTVAPNIPGVAAP